MKLKWEPMPGNEENIHVLYLHNDIPEAKEEKELIAAVVKKSKKEWVLAVEGRPSDNKIVKAEDYDEAESLCESYMINVIQEEIEARQKFVDDLKKMHSLRFDEEVTD